MDLIKETKTIPGLVNLDNFKKIEKVTLPEKISLPEIHATKKFNLNKILLIGFVLFMIFFFYNCKYGIFKSVQDEPVPYSLVYNLKK